MNHLMFSYMMQMLPIFVGALILLLLKSIRISRSKITIFVEDDASAHEAAVFGEPCTVEGFELPAEKPIKIVKGSDYIDSFFYDSLIVSGKLDRNSGMQSIRRQALKKLGYFVYGEIEDLPEYMKNCRSEKLTLFASSLEREGLLDFLSRFCESSGLLLWYAANGNLEVNQHA